jgi:glycosidase
MKEGYIVKNRHGRLRVVGLTRVEELSAYSNREGVYLGVPREFHVSRGARKKYDFDDELFSIRGNVIFPDFHASRVFAHKVNVKRDTVKHPELAVRAGQINAMGLIDEILHYVVTLYREKHGAGLFREALDSLKSKVGPEVLRDSLVFFVEQFPSLSVHRGEITATDYLAGSTDGTSNETIVLEELLLLWLANDNPAFAPFGEFFDDTDLRGKTAYLRLIAGIKEFFKDRPKFGPDNQTLTDMLKAPAAASPYSLPGQLEFIRKHWGLVLGDFLERLLRGMDVIKEEDKARWGFGPGPSETYTYTGTGYADEEFERFSIDRDWMPKVVLIAKSALVWLDQLSRRYRRSITTLDGVPDEELDILASRGITGLWLIGLWERSDASRKIKERCGNPDATASAYSLFDYEVAAELGGWPALENLRGRAWARGIRLASDMVPNHTGIESRWVIEHPDWFVQSDHPPFPGYTFNGESLSTRSDVDVFIEDHYYNRSDAAVVFKRVHRPSGDTRYLYHGNDGTHMPWNDTAQLNFLLPQVREAVIQTILHVAKNFPIIRFDAAMTLAKKHFQRLWYPEPGSGGDIPSRAERGLTKDEFNRLFPEEFWREVVDRAAAECPDTLLLAEAFWMMEGYFVRTLGMHRVYNSAFMNMLKNEDNDKYRATIKNTGEFDKNILKRFVNFMNNPDEETAVAQFGDGDKYFGVCTLMVTMPGLPMFGHGQIEGFTEKYGMEYRRAYRDETPNAGLVERHEREIFPLVKKRYLFAEVENFLLYDLYREDGSVNENLFAYSNRRDRESALVLYNNSLNPAWGWIKTSAASLEKGPGGEKTLLRRDLVEGLGLDAGTDCFCIFREQRSNRWFIRRSRDLKETGLYINLRGYESQVFLDIYEVRDNSAGTYRRLCEALDGAGVENMEDALRELSFSPLYSALRPLFDEWFPRLKDDIFGTPETSPKAGEIEAFKEACLRFFQQARNFSGGAGRPDLGAEEVLRGLAAAVRVFAVLRGKPFRKNAVPGWSFIVDEKSGGPGTEELVFAWAIFRGLGYAVTKEGTVPAGTVRERMEEWALDREALKFFARADSVNDKGLGRLGILIKILVSREDWFEHAKKFEEPPVRARTALESLLTDIDVGECAGINLYEGTVYFNREGFLTLLWWLGIVSLLKKTIDSDIAADEDYPVSEETTLVDIWIKAFQKADYKVDRLLENIDPVQKTVRVVKNEKNGLV